MQTFLPYPDFKKTVKCLDYRRLGKQRIEAMQIYNIITKKNKKQGWINHPAVKMWRGCEKYLAEYHNCCIEEWIKRGYNNTMKMINYEGKMILPFWFGDKQFHSCHRQTLLYKNLEWYSQFGWTEEPKYEYYWPVREG